jgi:hypothetical protein
MRNVKLPSGFMKVERSQEEKVRSYSVDDELKQDTRDEIQSRRIADAIIDSYERSSKRKC